MRHYPGRGLQINKSGSGCLNKIGPIYKWTPGRFTQMQSCSTAGGVLAGAGAVWLDGLFAYFGETRADCGSIWKNLIEGPVTGRKLA